MDAANISFLAKCPKHVVWPPPAHILTKWEKNPGKMKIFTPHDVNPKKQKSL